MSKKQNQPMKLVNTQTGMFAELPIIRTPYNAYTLPVYHEKITGPSNTVPDQSLTIKQILDRYARGMSLDPNIKVYEYSSTEENPELPDWKKLDLSEQQQYLEAARQNVRDIEQQLKAQVKTAKDNEIKKKREEREQLLKDLREQSVKPIGKQNPENPPSEL